MRVLLLPHLVHRMLPHPTLPSQLESTSKKATSSPHRKHVNPSWQQPHRRREICSPRRQDVLHLISPAPFPRPQTHLGLPIQHALNQQHRHLVRLQTRQQERGEDLREPFEESCLDVAWTDDRSADSWRVVEVEELLGEAFVEGEGGGFGGTVWVGVSGRVGGGDGTDRRQWRRIERRRP